MQFIGGGTLPLGALLGGFLGGRIGLRATFVLGCCGLFLAFLWTYFSPVRTLRLPADDKQLEPNLEGEAT
jgi:hypothetical protein